MDSACAPGVAGPAYADIEDGGEGGGDSRTKVESLTLGMPRNCRACSSVVVSVLSAPVLVETKRDSERCRTSMVPFVGA